MGVQLSPEARELIEAANFASLATLMPDGSIQVTPVWIDHDGEHVLFNTAEGRQKTRNLRRDGRVGLDVFDLQNPYHHVSIRGHVVSMTHEGALAHIDKMAKKYLGVDKYPNLQPGEQRVIVAIEPEHMAMQ
jgi:PPOX class probable F420-dependent enzyme